MGDDDAAAQGRGQQTQSHRPPRAHRKPRAVRKLTRAPGSYRKLARADRIIVRACLVGAGVVVAAGVAAMVVWPAGAASIALAMAIGAGGNLLTAAALVTLARLHAGVVGASSYIFKLVALAFAVYAAHATPALDSRMVAGFFVLFELVTLGAYCVVVFTARVPALDE